MLVHIHHFPPAVISLLASHPGIDLWNMPRCASKVALHVYAIDRSPVKERRDYSTPCGFGNFWCLRFALNVWPKDAPQLWEFLFPLGLFHVGSRRAFSDFPAVSSCLCCGPVGYSDHFFLFPLDGFLSGWMRSDSLHCFSVYSPSVPEDPAQQRSERKNSFADIRLNPK